MIFIKNSSSCLKSIVSDFLFAQVHLIFSLGQFNPENKFANRGLSRRRRSFLELSAHASIHLRLLRIESLLLIFTESWSLGLPSSCLLLVKIRSLEVCPTIWSNWAVQVSIGAQFEAIHPSHYSCIFTWAVKQSFLDLQSKLFEEVDFLII